ncbi:MAG TPA: glycosyltransferase family 4 protein [Chlamydiales bacterium]|nr:glycosyltransferase family 4 protein [Chlamydiales bacterium]
MRVVLLKAKLEGTGGLEKSTVQIGQAFLQKKSEVTLLTTKAEGSFPFKVHSFPTPHWPPSFRLEQFDQMVQKWLKAHPADIVFGMDRNRVQTHLRAGNGVHASWLQARRLIEGKWKSQLHFLNPLHRKILNLEKAGFEYPGLQKLFVNSQMVKGEVLSYYRVDEKKIKVVHNGVEWAQWQSPFDRWEEGRKEALQKFGLPTDCLHLLFIGNGYKRKGLDPLLQALSLWKRKEIHLSVVGKDRDLNSYVAQAKKLNIEEKVHFFGPVKEILPFYQMADLLVLPSFYDPFANVTVEALAMGLFVISSKKNGGCEVLNDQNGCIIQDHADPYSILTCLEKGFLKTKVSAEQIREKISFLDYSSQLNHIIDACLPTT